MTDKSEEYLEIVPAEVVEILPPEAGNWQPYPPPPPRRRRKRLPLLLFIATCLSTLFVGVVESTAQTYLGACLDGLMYSSALMTILVFHEMGHFIQSHRHGVFATWPFFIPVPLPPIGTMGAVIAMEPRMGHRRALFDIGISGPLAGLVPTLICCIVGIKLSEVVFIPPNVRVESLNLYGAPPLFYLLCDWFGKPLPPNHVLLLHPIAFAGWVGLLITSLNLIPIGQLDGGHVLYALLRDKAHPIATFLLFGALTCVVLLNLWSWALMLFLLIMMGPKHPPTANDDEPLGLFRTILGWLTLGFIFLGFTPKPFPNI